MKAARFIFAALFLAALGANGWGALTVQQKLSPPQVAVGDEVAVTYTFNGGDVEDFQMPAMDGVTSEGMPSVSSTMQISILNGTVASSRTYAHTFLFVANRAGNVIVPALDLKDAASGAVVKTRAMTLHVVGAATASSMPSVQVPVTPPSAAMSVAPPAVVTPGAGSRNGPVVMPPSGQDAENNPAAGQDDGAGGTTVAVPTDPDGQPARVFDLITPQVTTAYVGESVPLRIESYIRVDANAQQDSLPTLIGSDFLMNTLSLRPTEEGVAAGNIEYIRDSWLTAISAPRAGDFALQATRDTYWTKSAPAAPNDPFGPLFGRQSQLMHKDILSNKLVMHILPLPEAGKPVNFTGAIGKFEVSGNATPATVAVGEPVTLRFTVTGMGNFDYVRAPALPTDPAWKAYTPTSKITYRAQDESHTQAMKIFDQAVIPQKGGTLTLPAASFSYFNPDSKQYVTVPVTLPTITVTGTAAPAPVVTDAGTVVATTTGAAVNPAKEFAPNRLTFGALRPDLAPAYERTWFWVVQGVLAMAIIVGLVLAAMGSVRNSARDERANRHASLRREEDAMSEAVQSGDAVKFFAAARHAVQLRLAERWHVPEESLTLAEITRRDAALGETLAPLFTEADDVIYSGAAREGIDLHEWDRRAREMLEPVKT